jgi:hypothetical protein
LEILVKQRTQGNNLIIKKPKHDSCLERSLKHVSILLSWKS